MANDDAIAEFKAQFHRPEKLTEKPTEQPTEKPTKKLIHLNNAGQAPICRDAREALDMWTRRQFEEGAHSFPDLAHATAEAKVDVARFLGCKPRELAFFPGASGAISQIAFGLTLKPEDEIIVWDQEYPSNFYPWKVAADRTGAKIVVAESGPDLSTPLSAIERVSTPRTRVIASSWVQYRTGAIMDLSALSRFSRDRGIFTCVDVIQGAGCLPFDFAQSGLDAVCGGSHKWMASVHGAGFLALREEHLERVQPLMVGAMTFGTPDDKIDLQAKPKHDSSRFEPGGRAFLEIIALGAAARLFEKTGIARIAQEAEWLSRKLTHGLRELGFVINSPHGKHHRGAIANFSIGADSPLKSQGDIEKRLAASGVAFGIRPPGIRLSPHAFNTSDDLEKVLAALS